MQQNYYIVEYDEGNELGLQTSHLIVAQSPKQAFRIWRSYNEGLSLEEATVWESVRPHNALNDV